MHLNETLFYVFGIGLAVSAVLVTFLGLKVKGFPGKAFPLVIVWFTVFVAGATTFSVLHAQDEEHEKAAETEPAGVEFEEEAADVEAEEAEAEAEPEGGDEGAAQPSGGEAKPEAAVAGAATTLTLSADPTALAYDKKSLNAKAGKVLITFDNPSAIPHDVAIEQDGEEIAITEQIAEGKDSLSAELEPGSYTFLCTVPGHAEAGMEGTLTVK
jgi:plastocyanin